MGNFEKELYEKFLHEGTFVVNNVLKRNILKLKFMTLPRELKEVHDASYRGKDTPQSMSLAKIQRGGALSRNGGGKTPLQKTSRSSTQGYMNAFRPRKSFSKNQKFNILSTAIQWISSRPVGDNPDLALAEKLMKASESVVNSRSSKSHHRNDFKISQAKCKARLLIRRHLFFCVSSSNCYFFCSF
jgi:hypothetical protein